MILLLISFNFFQEEVDIVAWEEEEEKEDEEVSFTPMSRPILETSIFTSHHFLKRKLNHQGTR